jgi:hypothetical protein
MRGRNWAFVLCAGALTLPAAATGGAQAPPYSFTAIDIPGASLTTARDINDPHQIVGDFFVATGQQHGFLDT